MPFIWTEQDDGMTEVRFCDQEAQTVLKRVLQDLNAESPECETDFKQVQKFAEDLQYALDFKKAPKKTSKLLKELEAVRKSVKKNRDRLLELESQGINDRDLLELFDSIDANLFFHISFLITGRARRHIRATEPEEINSIDKYHELMEQLGEENLKISDSPVKLQNAVLKRICREGGGELNHFAACLYRELTDPNKENEKLQAKTLKQIYTENLRSTLLL